MVFGDQYTFAIAPICFCTLITYVFYKLVYFLLPSINMSTTAEEEMRPVAVCDLQINPENLKTRPTQKLKRCREESRNVSPSSKRQSPTPKERTDCSHPVYKKISLKNGEINRMTHKELIATLGDLKLDNGGFPDVLRKRLKMHYTNQSLSTVGLNTPQKYDYLCVIDFEATCERDNPANYLHEIIEFPIVLVNTTTRTIEDSFMCFCKPMLNPTLSEFCTSLTNITQTQVDYADTFPVVLERVNRWMEEKELGTKYTYAITTDGPWDMNMFMRVQCKLSQVTFPTYAKRWINLSKSFSNFYKTNRLKLEVMLKNLGYQFEGRPHRGFDDATNIARVAMKLMEDGCTLEINDRLT